MMLLSLEPVDPDYGLLLAWPRQASTRHAYPNCSPHEVIQSPHKEESMPLWESTSPISA